MSQKILESAAPFNDIFYKNCIHQFKLMGILYLGKDIEHILSNDVFFYNGQETSFIFQSDAIRDESELFKRMGIEQKEYRRTDNIFQQIENDIMDNNWSVVYIDSFYNPFQPARYQKIHEMHPWGVFGFDQEEKVFHVIDHEYETGLNYIRRIFSYDELSTAYEGLINDVGWTPSYYTFKNAEKVSRQYNYQKILQENYSLKKDEVVRGIQFLEEFLSVFSTYTKEESEAYPFAEGVFQNLLWTVRWQRMRRYQFNQIYSLSDELNQLLFSIEYNWNFIYTLIAKYIFSKKYKEIHFFKMENMIKDIIVAENKWASILNEKFFIN